LLFGLFFVFLGLRLRLHNIVHQILQIFVVNLLVAVLVIALPNLVIFLGPRTIHRSFSLPVAGSRLREMVVINHAVFGMTAALAILVVLFGVNMVLELLTVLKALVAADTPLAPVRLTLHLPHVLLICLRLRLLLLLHLFQELARVFVQVVLEVALLLKVFVCVRQKLRILLNLTNFIQMIRQLLGSKISVDPFGCFIDDLFDDRVFDDFFDVDRVVHVFKNAVFGGVIDAQNLEQLQPQVFQLVCVILKEVKIVTNCRQNLIKVLLRLTALLLRIIHCFHLFMPLSVLLRIS